MTRFILCAFLVIGLAACGNTLRGAGRDIERAGEAIQGAVD